MAGFPHDEMEEAFRIYWQTGAVEERWSNWADRLTPDVAYREQVYGHMQGREEVRAWIVPLMARYPALYTIYQWHQIDPKAGRLVVYMLNRRDHPAPSDNTEETLDFPGVTVLNYAGEGLFGIQEDYWAVTGAKACARTYAAACRTHDPDHPGRRSRLHWGHGPPWTRGRVTDSTEVS